MISNLTKGDYLKIETMQLKYIPINKYFKFRDTHKIGNVCVC